MIKAFKKELKGYRLTGLTDDGKSYMLKIYHGGRCLDYNRVYIADLQAHESIESKALEMIEQQQIERELALWGLGVDA